MIKSSDTSVPAGSLQQYKMSYEGGYPDCVCGLYYPLNLFITKDHFVVKSSFPDRKIFEPILIPFESTLSCEFVQSRISGLKVNNEIHIICIVQEEEYVVRLSSRKMLHLSNYNECQKIIDFLRTNGIFSKFRAAQTAPETGAKAASRTVFEQIEKLAELNKAGILTDGEFQIKKEELLRRI